MPSMLPCLEIGRRAAGEPLTPERLDLLSRMLGAEGNLGRPATLQGVQQAR